MFGDEHALEAQFFRFADALLDAVHRTDFTAQAHFARHAHAGFYFRVHIARKDGADDRQVDGRVVHFQSSGYVEEHVLLRQLEAYPFLQHGEQHVHPPQVESRGGTLGHAIGCRAHQCLHFDEERAYAFYGAGDSHSAHSLVVLREQQFRRVAHLPQPVLPHLVDAQLRRAPEAVLDAPQDAVHVVLVALELQYRVYDVFQHFRSGDASFLVDMSDEDDGRSCLFGELEDGCRTFAHLHDASRRRIDGFGRNGLYGVDDDQGGSCVLDVGEDLFQ